MEKTVKMEKEFTHADMMEIAYQAWFNSTQAQKTVADSKRDFHSWAAAWALKKGLEIK